jgi:hypothetical protein
MAILWVPSRYAKVGAPSESIRAPQKEEVATLVTTLSCNARSKARQGSKSGRAFHFAAMIKHSP